MSEQLESKENPDQYNESNPLESQKLVNEMEEQELVTRAKRSEIKQEEASEVINRMEPSEMEITDSVSIGNQTHIAVGANGFSVAGLEDVDLQYETCAIKRTHTEGVPGFPYDGITAHIDVSNNSGQLANEDKGTFDDGIKGKEKLIGPVLGSWYLRSKSQEKRRSPEPSESLKELDANRDTEKRGRKRKHTNKNIVNEFSRTKTHLRYLLHRIKYEQSLIDAYSAEGWKGQSLEKLKPEKELQRAKSHILRYKLKIRALFEHLDQSLAIGKLPESLFDPKGEIDSEDIFCAKCGSKDLTLDNDIILCDGACTRGFHQYCLEPPLLKDDIPPGDEGWICPGCNCKLDCIDMLKDFHSTKVSITDSWENIFPEAARTVSGNNLDDVSGSSDDDYDPEKPDVSQKDGEDKSCPDESAYFSAPDDLVPSHNNEIQQQGIPSDDSEDGDFDPSMVNQETPIMSESSDFSSDSEDLGALLEDEVDVQNLPASSEQFSQDPQAINFAADNVKRQFITEDVSYHKENAMEPVLGKRHGERLDYKKLHDEAYENYSSDSSDDDFGETPPANKRRRSYSEVKSAVTKAAPGEKLVNRRKNVDTRCGETGTGRSSTYKRLGEAVTQKLYSSFLKNKYPERSVKEELANELGISIRQVAKWFENARWSFNHTPQAQVTPDAKNNNYVPQQGVETSEKCSHPK